MTLVAPAQPALGRSPAARAANATLLERHDVSANLASYRLRLDLAPAGYRPGQYIALSLAADGGTVTRPYSIVSTVGRVVELLVRRLPDGALSSRLWQLPAGSRVRVGPPRGLFTVATDDARPRLYVAGGTGAAPFMAMLEAAARVGDSVPTTFLHAVSLAADLCFDERLRRWRAAGLAVDYRPSVSRPADGANAGWTGRTGRAEEQLQALLDEGFDATSSAAWLCGPAQMVDASRSLLLGAGMPAEAVRVELFHRPTVAA